MKDLITQEYLIPETLFASTDNVEETVRKIRTVATSVVFDVTTRKGKASAITMARKVATTKVAGVKGFDDFLAEKKAEIKNYNARKNLFTDTMDELRDDIRRPVTEMEEKEDARIAAHEANIDRLEEILRDIPASTDMEAIDSCINHVADVSSGDFEEYTDGKDRLVEKITLAIESRRTELELAEKQAAEIEQLKKEAAEREKKEREERIAREAAENARLEQEREIQAQRDREQLAIKRAEQEKIAAQQATIDAERREIEAAKQAEFDRQQAINRQKQDEKRHQEELERAAEVERKRLENIEAAKIFDAQCREADRDHRAKVNNEAMECLVKAGVSRTGAKQAITAIAKGLVEHVKIDY